MRTLIIHNPKSGFGSDAVYQFQRSVVRPGDECVFRLLEDDFDPREAVRDATDFDVVVASGGDGTVSGVMHALAGTGVAVCAFPSGDGQPLQRQPGKHARAAVARARLPHGPGGRPRPGLSQLG